MQLLKLFLTLGLVSAGLIDRSYPVNNAACPTYSCLKSWKQAGKWCQLVEPDISHCQTYTAQTRSTVTVTSTYTFTIPKVTTTTTTVTGANLYATCSPYVTRTPMVKRSQKYPVANPQQQKQCGDPPSCVRYLSPEKQRSACSCVHQPTKPCTTTIATLAPVTRTHRTFTSVYKSTSVATSTIPGSTNFVIQVYDITQEDSEFNGNYIYVGGSGNNNLMVGANSNFETFAYDGINAGEIIAIAPQVFEAGSNVFIYDATNDPQDGTEIGVASIGEPSPPSTKAAYCIIQASAFPGHCFLRCNGNSARNDYGNLCRDTENADAETISLCGNQSPEDKPPILPFLVDPALMV